MKPPRPELRLVEAPAPPAEAPGAAAPSHATGEPGAEQRRFVEGLFQRYRHQLLRKLRASLPSREDAEEVLQETYFRLLRAQHIDTAIEARARQFTFAIATNLVRDYYRRQKARAADQHVPYDSHDLVAEDPEPDNQIDWEQGLSIIRRSLLDLPERTRQVFLLHVHEQMSYRSISKHIGVSTKTVERDIALALALCQSRLRIWERR